ncbi:MHYT domain-containing protein [Steroidobacter sp.]|uniref:MHYT domain-containing protein n=1 Tax=Steroidobacter sp. TaxID=1978227 RepID=UPI001A4B431E|nr:MHYT domain-containing protein [Steroidobacter sp.]MBL8266117.1 response regulator [Steroidobacter sp.]
MHAAHHPIFVILSILTAWFGSWTALDLFRRVRAHGGAWQLGWIVAAGVAMGLSIWSMHFIAMLGFNPGSEVRYDVSLTLLSLALAMATTAFAFFFSARQQGAPRQLLCGVIMGAGICTMHYVGMAALITEVTLSNDPIFVTIAFVIAVSASTSALVMAARETTIGQQVLGALALGFAIVGMHYSAMMGVQIHSESIHHIVPSGADVIMLAVGVAAGTFFILLLTLIAALYDRRVEAMALREALRSEHQLRAILDNLPIGVLVAASPSGEIRFANVEAQRLLAKPVGSQALWDQPLAGSVIDNTGERLLPENYVLYKAMAENRRIEPQVQAYRRANGELAHFEVTAAPIEDRGEPTLAVAAFQDVTAKLQADQRVNDAVAAKAEAEAALMHAQRLDALGRLTGGVAHDFNNLLTVVIGALDVILQHPENAARRKRLGEAALAAARRGERLTAQLLAFARRQPLQPQACDLNELIRESEPLLRRATGESLSVKLKLCEQAAIALIDPTQFEASLFNLLVNAADASPPGSEIVLQTQLTEVASGELPNLASGRYVQVTVSDRGAGMSEDILSRIFEPFFTTKAPGKGTGLGLSQVHGFVRQSGGEVQVQSAVGEGTSFSVYLPIGTAVALPETSADTPPPAPALSLNILLTEDDASVAGIVEVMLADLGHKVTRAANADEALHLLRSDTHIDALLSDVVMPGGMNGVELAKRAQQLRPQLKILLSSGYAGEALDASLAHSAWPFLRKPYLASELADALARLRPAGDHDQTPSRRQA